jgi:membrane associated rhomboid family serine protease
MGARFVPCIRSKSTLNIPNGVLECPVGVETSTSVYNPSSNSTIPTCTLEQLCGLWGFNGGQPNQWYRFFTAIFLHGGVLHLLFNISFQVITGFKMERDFGWWRMALIYCLSGIGSFIFSGCFTELTPSIGGSGSIYGIYL